MKTRDMTLTAMFTALLCVTAPFAIPIGLVPISPATFVIYITASVLGWKQGTIAVVVYIALGAVGLPVFSGFEGGFHKVAGVTGGYIIGYIPLALAAGLTTNWLKHKKWAYILGMVIGTILLYTLGTIWFSAQTGRTLVQAAAICVIPFLPGDAVKIAVAAFASPVLRRTLGKNLKTTGS